jgi:hypothetical protein
MMEAARTSETSVDIKLRTRQYIPEDSERYESSFSEDFYILLNLNTNHYIPC